jgi:hypothetical protein
MAAERKKSERKKEWTKRLLHTIIGSMNQTMFPEMTLSCTFEGVVEDSEDIRHLLVDQIDGNDQTAWTSSSEPLSSSTHFQFTSDGNLIVSPLTLGRVAFCQTATSVKVSARLWLDALTRISFKRICRSRLYGDDVQHITGKQLHCGSALEGGGERRCRWREYKMCDTFEAISCRLIVHYLEHSFLPCLHAVQPNHTAQLWVGISDTNAVIGIKRGDRNGVRIVFSEAIETTFSRVFPPIPSECIKITIHEATGSRPTDWTGNKCYQQMLTGDQARDALHYFVGRCVIEKIVAEDEETDCDKAGHGNGSKNDNWCVSVEAKTYESVCSQVFEDRSPPVGSDTVEIAAMSQKYHNSKGSSKSLDHLRGWELVACDDVADTPRIMSALK